MVEGSASAASFPILEHLVLCLKSWGPVQPAHVRGGGAAGGGGQSWEAVPDTPFLSLEAWPSPGPPESLARSPQVAVL